MRRTPVAHVLFPRPSHAQPVAPMAWEIARRVAETPGLDVEIVIPIPAARALSSAMRAASGKSEWPAELEALLSRLDPKPTLARFVPVPRRSIESAATSLSAMFLGRRRAVRPALLHGSYLDEGGFAASSSATALGLPSIAIAHGGDVGVLHSAPTSTRAKRTRATVHHATELIATSDALTAELSHLGRAAEVLRFAADERRIPLSPTPPGRPMALFVGELSRASGVDVLLEALAWTRLSLRMIGPPGDVDVAAKIAELDLGARVELLGEQAELGPHYAEAALVVLPARNPVSARPLVEGLLRGRPFVATPDCELGAIGGGRVVKPDDPEALARALEGVYGAKWRPAALREAALPWCIGGSAARLAELTLSLVSR